MGTKDGTRPRPGNDFVDAVTVDVGAGHLHTPSQGAISEEADPGDRNQRTTVVVPAAYVGSEDWAWPGAGENLVHAVAVDVGTGHVHAPPRGAVGEEVDSGHGHGAAALHLPAAYVGSEDRARSGAGDDFVNAVTVQVAAGDIDPEGLDPVSQELHSGDGAAVTGKGAHQGRVIRSGPRPSDDRLAPSALDHPGGNPGTIAVDGGVGIEVDDVHRRAVGQVAANSGGVGRFGPRSHHDGGRTETGHGDRAGDHQGVVGVEGRGFGVAVLDDLAGHDVDVPLARCGALDKDVLHRVNAIGRGAARFGPVG